MLELSAKMGMTKYLFEAFWFMLDTIFVFLRSSGGQEEVLQVESLNARF